MLAQTTSVCTKTVSAHETYQAELIPHSSKQFSFEHFFQHSNEYIGILTPLSISS